MITIRYDTSRERTIISVEGHANHGEEGKDTVCAAVSALVFTLCRVLSNYDKKGALKSFYHSVEKGSCQLDFAACDAFRDSVETAANTLFEGFLLLEENYPECVSVI